jgi:hypothetical protein
MDIQKNSPLKATKLRVNGATDSQSVAQIVFSHFLREVNVSFSI